MHSGFERPRGALHGVIAHQARANNPLPSHAFFAGRADLAAAVDVCTFGRAARGRSRGTGRAACGTAVDRFGAVGKASAVTADSVPGASCASALTMSATGAIEEGVVGAGSGIGARGGVATTLVCVANAAASDDNGSPAGGNDGRSSAQTPQPRAAMPVTASAAATLR